MLAKGHTARAAYEHMKVQGRVTCSYSAFCPTNFLEDVSEAGLHNMTIEGVAVTVATPERAALEMLYLVPREIGFSEALEVIGGLAALRVERMQTLLEGCSSVKVKRLFLYTAREAGHSWYTDLDRSRIDLGAGKRELVKGGKLDKEFLLTVPANPYAWGETGKEITR